MGTSASFGLEDNSSHVVSGFSRTTNRWPARITRAQMLAERHPPAADILRFYAQLAAHQQTLAVDWSDGTWDPPRVLEALPVMLNWLTANGPPGLSRSVQSLRDTPIDEWTLTLDRFLAEDAFDADDAALAFVIEVLLQPLAEACAAAIADLDSVARTLRVREASLKGSPHERRATRI